MLKPNIDSMDTSIIRRILTRSEPSVVMAMNGCETVFVNASHNRIFPDKFVVPASSADALQMLSALAIRRSQPMSEPCYCSDTEAPVALAPDDCPFEQAFTKLGTVSDENASLKNFAFFRTTMERGHDEESVRCYKVLAATSKRFTFNGVDFLEVYYQEPEEPLALVVSDIVNSRGESLRAKVTVVRSGKNICCEEFDLSSRDYFHYRRLGAAVSSAILDLSENVLPPDTVVSKLVEWVKCKDNPSGFQYVAPHLCSQAATSAPTSTWKSKLSTVLASCFDAPTLRCASVAMFACFFALFPKANEFDIIISKRGEKTASRGGMVKDDPREGRSKLAQDAANQLAFLRESEKIRDELGGRFVAYVDGARIDSDFQREELLARVSIRYPSSPAYIAYLGSRAELSTEAKDSPSGLGSLSFPELPKAVSDLRITEGQDKTIVRRPFWDFDELNIS